MLTSVSLGVALLVFALGLLVQSRMLLLSQDRLPSLGRRLCQFGFASLLAGVALLAPGFIVTKLYDTYIPMGCTLLIVGVGLIVQGVSLVRRTDREALGNLLQCWSFIGLAVASVLLVVLIAVTLL